MQFANPIRLSRSGLPTPSFIPVVQIQTTYVSPVRVRPLSIQAIPQSTSFSVVQSPISRVLRPQLQSKSHNYSIVSNSTSMHVTSPSMIKTTPKETERVGGICASYQKENGITSNQSTQKLSSAAKCLDKSQSLNHSHIHLNRSLAMTNDSILQPSYSLHQQQPHQQQSQQHQPHLASAFLNNSFNQAIDTSFISSIANTGVKNSQAPLQNSAETESKANLQHEANSSPKKQLQLKMPQSMNSATMKAQFSTPLRTKNESISHEELKARLASGGGEWSNKIEESAKCKIFTEEFLEHREKDFKRRIENLELQNSIMKDQLQFKDSKLETQSRENQDLSTKVTSLENTVASISSDKEQIHYHLTAEIEQLRSIIEQLNKENAVLMQSQSNNRRF